MSTLALIDATHHTAEAPASRVLAGLTLLERALRLAAVCGCKRAWVLAPPEALEAIEALAATTEAGLDEVFVVTAAPDLAWPEAERYLYLRSEVVYERGMVQDALAHFEGGVMAVRPTSDRPFADLLVFDNTGGVALESLRGFDVAPSFFEALRQRDVTVKLRDDARWQRRVHTDADAREAAKRLWNGCRKPLDGLVSRYINRNISITISRLIAATSIRPNHISIVTFSLGLLGGVLAGLGGYWGFLWGGVVFQANSIIDGVDGELARVRYEFSVLGEWLDTLSDDLSDVFYWTGLGIGAWRTFDAPFHLPQSLWLWLAGISVFGKGLSMLLYYRWLIARGRGDLLAFQWSFNADEAEREPSALMAFLANAKYLTKKDFIVFALMMLGFAGLQPWMLWAAAPGNLVVAAGVVLQDRANRRRPAAN